MFGAGFSVKKAHLMQSRLSKRVIREDMIHKPLRSIAGVDVAYFRDLSIGAVALLDYSSLALVETQKALVKTVFPYIPTLLSLREIRPAKAAIKKLKTDTDVFLVDAQGIAHPYRLGFASHLGILLDKPTVGVAKNLLCGRVESVNQEGWAPITDKNEVIGAAVATKGQKPVYVSIGHMISLETAIEIARHCTISARIPEPIRLAHIIAGEEKTRHKEKIVHQSNKGRERGDKSA